MGHVIGCGGWPRPTACVLTALAASAKFTAWPFGRGAAGPEAARGWACIAASGCSCVALLTASAPFITGGCTLWNGCSSRGAAGAVEVVVVALAIAIVAGADPAPQRLRFIEAIRVIAPVASTAHAGFRQRLVVVEERGAPCLLSGDPTQAHALIGEKHCGACEQKLAELEDRIQAPPLKK